MGPRDLPHTIRHYSGGGCATAFLGVFLVMILFSLSKFLVATAGLSPVVAQGACAAVALVSLLALYFFFSAETVATVDAEGMTAGRRPQNGLNFRCVPPARPLARRLFGRGSP